MMEYDEQSEYYWEDDLYQLNQNEADDYRNEFNEGGPMPEFKFELGEYRIVMNQMANALRYLKDGQLDDLLTNCLEALIQAGYRGYELMYSESYDEYTDKRINALIDGAKIDAEALLRSFGGDLNEQI